MVSNNRRASPIEARRNFWLGIANGVLFSLSEALADANLVLTLFIRHLSDSNVLVGLLPALKNGGWLIPQLFVAGRIQPLPRKVGVYRTAAVARVIAWLGLMATIFGSLKLSPGLALTAFFVAYTLFTLSGGSSSLAFQEIVAKVIPVRRRGAFFSYRQLLGGLLAFAVAAPLVRALIRTNGPLAFPYNYGVLCALSLVALAGGLLSFAFVDEPPLAGAAAPASVMHTVRHLPMLIRSDLDFRRFITNRLLSRLAGVGEPFYVVYATEVLRIAPRFVGVYLAVRVLSAALSNLWWGRMGDTLGNRRLMVATSALVAMVPWAVILIPAVCGGRADLLAWSFALVFLLIGLSVDGSGTASMTYLLEIAPPTQRPVYLGLANTMLGLVTFVPVMGGVLLPILGYTGLFILAGLLAVCTWLSTLRLREPMQIAPILEAA